jgi:caffeoyl-CoA O-methyltransferase
MLPLHDERTPRAAPPLLVPTHHSATRAPACPPSILQPTATCGKKRLSSELLSIVGMAFPPVDERIEAYMRQLSSRHDEPVLLEMEQLGHDRDFPIIDRLVGELVEVLALSVGATRVFEMGSGYGYSAYWFTRAVGPDGSVICTDSDPANRDLAAEFLSRVHRWERVEYIVGSAQDALRRTPGEFDIVYNDIDKQDYPEAWQMARERVRPGGLYICDNVLWSGRVTDQNDRTRSTEAIRRHNQMVYADATFDACVIPTRDGVLVARRRSPS